MRSEIKNLPEAFLARLKKIIPQQKFDSAANTFAEEKPTTFRVNTLKTDARTVKESLERQNFSVSAISWFPSAFILKRGRQRDLEKTELYVEGEIYVQNLSSMIPPLVLGPQPNETILDLTAAPGGKTTEMACLMRGEGLIVANENDKVRFEKLKTNLAAQGVECAEAILSYGESFGNKRPEQFDRVLVDAPCSAEGRFLASEPSSYRYWNLDKVKDAAKLQKKLIISGLKALRPGGVLVYSTCTFSPEENEEVIQCALETFKDSIELESFSLGIQNQMPGLAKWQEKQFDSSIKKTFRVLPTPEMEGFFVARLKKKKPFAPTN